MNVKNLLQEVQSLHKQGIETVNLTNLESALSQLDQAASTEIQQTEWAKISAKLQSDSNLAHYNALQQLNLKNLEATIAFGSDALKSAILINGGAAVAILAYLGNSHLPKANSFANSLLCFTSGILLAAIATGISYLSQGHYASNLQPKGDNHRRAAIVFVVLSYLAFLAGSLTSYIGFISIR